MMLTAYNMHIYSNIKFRLLPLICLAIIYGFPYTKGFSEKHFSTLRLLLKTFQHFKGIHDNKFFYSDPFAMEGKLPVR